VEGGEKKKKKKKKEEKENRGIQNEDKEAKSQWEARIFREAGKKA